MRLSGAEAYFHDGTKRVESFSFWFMSVGVELEAYSSGSVRVHALKLGDFNAIITPLQLFL